MRKLTKEEIDYITDIIKVDTNIPDDIASNIYLNIKNDIILQLSDISIYPSCIDDLKNKIYKQFYLSKINPGEMVGCIASSSIGEKSTQAQLNTFHSSGQNKAAETSGLERLTELLNATKLKDMKTPLDKIYFTEDINNMFILNDDEINIPNKLSNENQEVIDKYRKNYKKVYKYKKICESYIKFYSIKDCLDKNKKPLISDKMNMNSYEKNYYSFFETFYFTLPKNKKWYVRLYFNVNTIFNCRKSLEFIANEIMNFDDEVKCVFFPDNIGIIDIWFNEYFDVDKIKETIESEIDSEIEEKKTLEKTYINYVNPIEIDKNFINKTNSLNKNFVDKDDELELNIDDTEKELILNEDLEINNIRENINSSINETEILDELKDNDSKLIYTIKNFKLPLILNIKVSGIKNIKDCEYNQNNDFIKTSGTNLKDLMFIPFIDFKKTNSTFSNSIWDLKEIFGIEAVKSFLDIEFSRVMNDDINKKHLHILINSMTYSGDIKPVTRYGIDVEQAGVLAKASFEQSFDNFLIASERGSKDNLDGVSASIMVGKLARIGTGMIDVINIKDDISLTKTKTITVNESDIKEKQDKTFYTKSKTIDKGLAVYKTKSRDKKSKIKDSNDDIDIL